VKKRSPLVVCPILFAIVVVVVLTYMFLNPLPIEYYIFENIEECENLIPQDQSNINIDRYDTPIADKDLKGLPYCDFFGMEYESDTLEYKIFAYEFENSDSAMKYYLNVTGKADYGINEKDFSASKGMLSYRVIVIYQNKVYQLIAPNRYVDEVSKLLAETFSQRII